MSKPIDLSKLPAKRQLPKLMTCMTKASLEKMRETQIENVQLLDSDGVRRKKLPLHECIILELRESGFEEGANYLRDLIEDNIQLVNADDLGIVVDLRKKPEYLEHLNAHLRRADKERREENPKAEALLFIDEAKYFAEKEKGILWLAEKLFLAGIAVSMQYMVDGGRLQGCCKYHYAKFLLEKFAGAQIDESYNLLINVRNKCAGKSWLLWEPEQKDEDPDETLVRAVCVQLHRVLLTKSKAIRKGDPAKSETLARLAERRAEDANDKLKMSEAVLEIGICQLVMNNLNNAHKTFERALKMFTETNNIEGLCETIMHLAAVMQRKGEYDTAVNLLTEMGTLAVQEGITRQLGRALHLLGELYLRQDRPELGTVHLLEAFLCFIGMLSNLEVQLLTSKSRTSSVFINKLSGGKTYLEEAEQSRLMMAVSAGQEVMKSYFEILREAKSCSVATLRVIEWKLTSVGWWVKRQHHDYVPCICPKHNRTPLDVLWMKMTAATENEAGQAETVHSLSTLRDRSNFDGFKSFRVSADGFASYINHEDK